MGFLLLLIQGLTWIIIIDALASWFVPSREQFPRNLTTRITEPLYAPFRAFIDPQKTGGLDITPLLALLVLQLIKGLLLRV